MKTIDKIQQFLSLFRFIGPFTFFLWLLHIKISSNFSHSMVISISRAILRRGFLFKIDALGRQLEAK